MRIFVDDYLQVRYINLYNEKVTDDLKILAISDIHISNLVSFKKIKRIERQFLKEKADYIVFVGDLIDRVEEINNSDSLFKLRHLLEFSAKVAKTFVVLGNHDYIHRENYSSYKEKISLVIKNIQGITLLDNDVYSDDELWLMGYTETIKYYRRKNYDFKEFYNDFSKHDLLYKNVDKRLPSVALVHSPEFSDDKRCISLLNKYDLIICGHTHDGCVPFGVGEFTRGIISPKKKFFPKNVRGIRKIGNGYILVTGGVIKISKCAPKKLHFLNHLCPMQMDVIIFSKHRKFSMKKKWY